jgi:hypothetical protein
MGTGRSICVRLAMGFLLLAGTAAAKSVEEAKVEKLGEAIAATEFLLPLCYVRARESRLAELRVATGATPEDLAPEGRLGTLLAKAREDLRSRLARSLQTMGRRVFCEYAWHAYGAYGERFVRRPR